MGGGIFSVIFLSADSAGPDLALHIQPVWNSDGFFFYINKAADKTGGGQAGLGTPMFQRQISRDKVHTIFKNSKLNVKIYIRNTRAFMPRGV